MWSLDILSLDGTSTVETTAKFRSGRITWALDGSGAAELNLMPADVASGNWLYGRRRLLFKDGDSTPRYQGWLDRLERSGRPGEKRYRAASRGLGAILSQRIVHGQIQEFDVEAMTIASDLIEHMVGQDWDATNFTIGTITGTCPNRKRLYCDGVTIEDAINELAAMDNGFAWEIDESGAFNAWAGGRGSDLSGSVTLPLADPNDWNYVGDVTDLATYVTGIGNVASEGSGECPITVVDHSAIRGAYGRREVVLEDDLHANDFAGAEAELFEKTTEELRARAASGSSLKVAWVEGRGPWDFGDVWMGDVVNAELGTEFGGDAPMRLITATISLEPGRHEFCEYEFEAA